MSRQYYKVTFWFNGVIFSTENLTLADAEKIVKSMKENGYNNPQIVSV